MTVRVPRVLSLCALVLCACVDEADSTSRPEAGASSAPIPIALWVDDLIAHHTTESAMPDTVDDKNIQNTEDVAAFGKYFK